MLQAYMHWLGFGLCHQLPERSFFGGGVQLPVCARDTGIYVGFCVSLVVVALLHRGERPREFPSPWGWAAVGLMIAAMGWDGVTSYAGMRTTTNDLRLLTGLLAGFALNVIIIPMLNDSLWRDSSPGRVLDPGWRLGAWLACVPIAFGAVKWGGPLLGVGYPVLVSIAIFVTLICVNMVMICLTPWFDRKAVRLLDAWPSIALGLLAAILEIGLAGLFRIGINLIALRFL